MVKRTLLALALLALISPLSQPGQAAVVRAGPLDFDIEGGHFYTQTAADKVGDAARNAVDKTKDKIGDIDVKTEKSPGQTADLPAGIQKATKDDSNDIRHALANLSEAVMSKDLHEVREKLVDADRNRLKDLKKNDPTFAGRIEQINKDWKAKYGKNFDIEHKIAFGADFKGFTIVQGEIVNPALLSNWPVENSKAQSGAGISSSRRAWLSR